MIADDLLGMMVDATRRLLDSIPEDRPAAWRAVEEQGLPVVLVAEAQGGLGCSVDDAFVLFELFGRRAVPLPVVETMIANLLLSQADLPLVDGMGTLAFGSVQRASRAPWGHEADTVVLCDDRQVVRLPRGTVRTNGVNLAGEPRITLQWDDGAGTAAPWSTNPLLLLAAARAAQIAGALDAMVASSLDHVGTRVQFGRALSAFQSVQQQLAIMAEETAAASVAARLAAEAVSATADPVMAVAVASIRVAEAVGTVTGIAHQLHGAIGTTREHQLHRASLRALAWREEARGVRYWTNILGERALSTGPDGYWPMVTAL